MGIKAAKLTHEENEGLSHEGRMLRSQRGQERQQERFLRTNLGEHTKSLPDQVCAQHPSQLREGGGCHETLNWARDGCTTLGEQCADASHPLVIIAFARPPSHQARVQR